MDPKIALYTAAAIAGGMTVPGSAGGKI